MWRTKPRDRFEAEGDAAAIQAIIVYPMNALANSQLGELEKFCAVATRRTSRGIGSLRRRSRRDLTN